MQLFYDTLAVHNLGEFTISQSREYEGGEAPQRSRVTLRVVVDVFEDTFADNYTLLAQLHAALKKQNVVLRWTNEDTSENYVNQTVTLVSVDMPEDPSAWGSWHQQLVFTVSYHEHDLVTANLPLVFTPTGQTAFTLGNVTGWRESSSIARVSNLRSHRNHAERQITVTGLILSDTKATLATRRTALIAQKVLLDKLVEKDGLLQFGSSPSYVCNRTVRVTEFSCEVNQLVSALEYSFTCQFTLFPNEAGYALVDYTCDQRDGQTGEQFLALNGVIGAQTEAAARAKLETLTTALLLQYGYNAAQLLTEGNTAKRVEADVDGDAFTELNFTREWRRFRSDNQMATFRKTGGAAAVSLGEVRQWNMDYDARRFSEQRSQRSAAMGRIEASGTFKGDASLSVSARRTALLTAQQAMQDEVNAADGALVYGSAFSKTVRVDHFKAEINQALNAIDWSLTAQWSRFPNEAGYATAEFNVATRDSVEDGEEQLSFSGRILSQNRAAAVAKLDSLRASVLTLYGYTAAQRLGGESNAQNIYANGDASASAPADADWAVATGVSFLELTFNETYRRRAASLISWNLTTSVRDDTPSGLAAVTYSGSVSASGASADAAYAAALAKAGALGGGKELASAVAAGTLGVEAVGFLKSKQVNWTTRQTTAGNTVEFVRLDFSYEYQAKMGDGRKYAEYSVTLSEDSFGANVESVSGSVTAANALLAEEYFNEQVMGGYAGRLIHSLRKTQNRIIAQAAALGFSVQETRLEFSFEAHSPKPVGKAAVRYAVAVSMDWLTLETITRVSGSVTAADRAAADAALALVSVAGGTLLRSDRTEDSEWTQASGLTGFLKLDFDDTYISRITGDSGVIEMRVTESVNYSGSRLVVQPTLKNSDGSGGFSVVQDLSVQEGSRTVRVSASSASRTDAEDWCKARRTLLTGSYKQPEQWETDYEFIPRISGVLSGTGANVKLHRVSASFGEILPNLPPG